MTNGTSYLLSLPPELILILQRSLHNIEDLINLSTTCSYLHACLALATPNTILRLAAGSSTTCLGPDPLYLVAATARELGHWARLSQYNELTLATTCLDGVGGLLELAKQHCGLTLARIAQLHSMRASVFNPIIDIIESCIGPQRREILWRVDHHLNEIEEPDKSHLFYMMAIYGELFAPDIETFLLGSESVAPRLRHETRLEYVKYCIPDWASYDCQWQADDPRRAVEASGPFYHDYRDICGVDLTNYCAAMIWLMNHSRWLPHWRALWEQAGPRFPLEDGEQDRWPLESNDHESWKQRLWESIMACQGLEGFEMIRPGLQDSWIPRIRRWREQIARLEKRPDLIFVEGNATFECPFLQGDVRVVSSGRGQW